MTVGATVVPLARVPQPSGQLPPARKNASTLVESGLAKSRRQMKISSGITVCPELTGGKYLVTAQWFVVQQTQRLLFVFFFHLAECWMEGLVIPTE